MKKSITQLIWISLFVSVIYNVQAQVCDGMPHAYRSTLDTCQKENYSVVVFDGEKIYLGSKYFKVGQALYIDGYEMRLYCLVWDFSHKDNNGNSIYQLETDSTRLLIVPPSPKFIVNAGDTLRHLSSTALAEGKLEWDNPYFDESLSLEIHCSKCHNCGGTGKYSIYLFDGTKRNMPCDRCGGYGNACLVISNKRATGVAIPADK